MHFHRCMKIRIKSVAVKDHKIHNVELNERYSYLNINYALQNLL